MRRRMIFASQKTFRKFFRGVAAFCICWDRMGFPRGFLLFSVGIKDLQGPEFFYIPLSPGSQIDWKHCCTSVSRL